MRNIRALVFAALLLNAVAIISCGDDEDETPTITRFTVDRMEASAGESVALSWQVENAASISIAALPGGTLVDNQTMLVGSTNSQPLNESTTFTLTAKNAGGKTSQSAVTVTVTGIRINSFTATPMTITRGEMTSLAYAIAGTPTTVQIVDSADVEV